MLLHQDVGPAEGSSVSIVIPSMMSGWQEDNFRTKIMRAGLNPSDVQIITLNEIASLRPAKVIVGLGEAVLRHFSAKRGVDKWCLSPLVLPDGTRFIPTYDLARANAQYELNLYIELALRRAFEISTSPWPTTTERFLINPGLEETLSVLKRLETADEIAVDVETGYGQINTVGFAWSESDAIAINVLPDRFADHSYFELWRAIARVLESPSRKIFQNFIYDTSYFSAYGVRTNGEIFDTMHAMKVLYPELKSNLGNVGRFYTKRIYWKDDGKVTDEEGVKKDWGNVRDWTKHYTYNCLSKNVKVITEHGPKSIGELVRNKINCKVYSWNEVEHCFEWKPITNWLAKRESQNINWTVIKTEWMRGGRGLFVTPDHKILTYKGWKRADQLKPYDLMLREEMRHDAGTAFGTVLGDSSLTHTSDKSVAYMSTCQINEELVSLKQYLFGGAVNKVFRSSGYKSGDYWELYVPACVQFARMKHFNDMRSILGHLTPMGLALWFMDDGCKQKDKYSPCVKFAMQSYSAEDRVIALEFFRNRYAESTGSIDKAGNLVLSTKMSRKFCVEIGPYVVPSLRYKMSHTGPDFSLELCAKYKSKVEPVNVRVIEVTNETKKKRGYSTSYCISVADNYNFLTEYGVVANCRDTTGTFEASLAQRKDLKDRNLWEFFTYVQSLVEPIREMCGAGMPLSLEARDEIRESGGRRIADLLVEFRAVAGDVNPASPKQLLAYLTSRGVKIPKKYDPKTKEYKPSTDSSSLKKIHLKHPEMRELKVLQEIKSLSKALSSYVNFDVRPDGRLSYSLNGCGTETLRFCIAANTEILTSNGAKQIKDIRQGDLVYCYDENLNVRIKPVLWQGKTGERAVVRVHWRSTSKRRGYLDVTPEHKFLMRDGTYLEACKLKPQNKVCSLRRYVNQGHWVLKTINQMVQEHKIIYRELRGGEPEVVHHMDHDPFNNDINNLCGMTIKEHVSHHAKEDGRKPARQPSSQERARGSNIASAKLHEEDVINIKKALCEGAKVIDLANRYGVHRGAITKIKMGHSWKHVEYSNHSIERIELLPDIVDVYDIEVADCHNFIANEICVHNSGNTDAWGRGVNVQTLPREGGAVSVKSMFVAPPGYTFIEADLKAAETYYVAYASVCKKMMDMLHSGEDIHRHVALAILRALSRPETDYTKMWRNLGKKTGHGANYLMKEGTFVENVFKDMDMVLTKVEGKTMLESYFQEFPEIRMWHGQIKNELYTKRKLSAPSGWERYFYGRPGDDMLREAVPWAPQHTVPWIINHMMFHLMDERRKGNLKFQLITQVHDSLLLLVPDEYVGRVGRECLKTDLWAPEINLPGGKLVIPVEVETARCLAEKKAFEGDSSDGYTD